MKFVDVYVDKKIIDVIIFNRWLEGHVQRLS